MLKGSLQTVALPEVLNFLADTGKSGEFHVSGGHGEGRLWFDHGRISGFQVARSEQPAEAIFELLRISGGEFDFVADVDRPEDVRRAEGDTGVVAPALEAAEARFAQWRDILAVVPSLEHRVQLRAEAPAEAVSLQPEQWVMVVSIGDGRTVGQVIEAREMQEFDGCKAVADLVEASLVEVLEPAVEVEPEVEDSVVEEPVAAVEPDLVGEEPVAEEHEAEEPVGEAAVDEPVAEVADAEPDQEDSDPVALLEFGVTEAHQGWDVKSDEPAGVDTPEPVYSPFSFATGEAQITSGSQEADHYAALRAAMVEVGENLTGDEPEQEYAESAHPVYEFHADPEMDSRAALQALLNEVADDGAALQPVHDEAVDGLADRGPWTEHELSAMDSEHEAWSEPGYEVSNIVPFAPVQAADDEAVEGDVAHEPATADVEGAGNGDGEEAPPAEEPINRGLLLKFLSSVRN